MTMEMGTKIDWVTDIHAFINHWEREVETIKNQQLDADECNEITKLFQQDKDMLLSKRPVDISDEHALMEIQPLADKLDASLARALCSVSIKHQD